ncbi:hypothetical protein LYSIN_01007 [Lysinibacillus sphaericus]|uniref:RNA polymerase alpha subunit C-terminal domain-containing protein n=1 Tax=Lysinibacillus sphaericus TaxID=1421 RepID=A0A2S5CZJ1_LYSSH|nr:hypothetical protein [Lysinibacillus sphaericus]POZ56224.1 hypothetical protein LYSIN_01007 [Lysinibacillus sphaericus]
MVYENETVNLLLAAEDFSNEEFVENHHFLSYEESIIKNLMAHGPILLKGGRGTGKSALLREAARRLEEEPYQNEVLGIYLSLRHLPLLRTRGKEYEVELLRILSDKINEVTTQKYNIEFPSVYEVYDMHNNLTNLSIQTDKRIVLLLDDAAHIGREASLEEFFDIFRTLSSSRVSCKASIYPGVTRFGSRFDIYNDANVIEIQRREGKPGFNEFFQAIMETRFPKSKNKDVFINELGITKVSNFLGMAVVGNVRSYVKICGTLFANGVYKNIGYNKISETLLEVSSDYYWPMIDEIKLKLGVYEPLIEPAQEFAEIIYSQCGQKEVPTCIIQRDIILKTNKLLEILEYTGFLSKREASRGMKSGGRGARYFVNLCNLLEKVPGSRLTKELFEEWEGNRKEDIQFSKSSVLGKYNFDLNIDTNEANDVLSILELPIEKLKKSNIFPYGITDNKLELLESNGYKTVNDLASARDEEILKIDGIGNKTLERFKSVIGQAIWM